MASAEAPRTGDLPLPDMEIEIRFDTPNKSVSEIEVKDKDPETGNTMKFAYTLKAIDSNPTPGSISVKYKVTRVRRIG